MKTLLTACFVAALPVTSVFASPSVDVQAATADLGRASSYAWVTTEKVDGYKFHQPTSIRGQTVKGGLTEVTLGYSGRKDAQAIFAGDQYVVQTDKGWSTPRELAKEQEKKKETLAKDDDPAGPGNRIGGPNISIGASMPGITIGSGGAGIGGGGIHGGRYPGGGYPGGGYPGGGYPGGGYPTNPFPPTMPDDGEPEVDLKLLAKTNFYESDMILRRPDEIVPLLAGGVSKLTTGADGVITGELNPETALELIYGTVYTATLRFDLPAPRDVMGTVRFWVKDWQVAKYEVQVSGTFAFGKKSQDYRVRRTMTTEVKDIGQTKVRAPDEARIRLGR